MSASTYYAQVQWLHAANRKLSADPRGLKYWATVNEFASTQLDSVLRKAGLGKDWLVEYLQTANAGGIERVLV